MFGAMETELPLDFLKDVCIRGERETRQRNYGCVSEIYFKTLELETARTDVCWMVWGFAICELPERALWKG